MFNIILLVILLIYSAVLLFVVFSAFWAFVTTRVPFVPSPIKDLERLIKYLELTATDKVLDIGSGNGRVVFVFENLTPARVMGIEAGLWMHLVALIHKKYKGSRAEFLKANFFKRSWRRYFKPCGFDRRYNI